VCFTPPIALPAARSLPRSHHSVADISNWQNHRTLTPGFDMTAHNGLREG